MLTSSFPNSFLVILVLLLPRDVSITSSDHVSEFGEVCNRHGVLGQNISRIVFATDPLEIELFLQESIKNVQLSQVYKFRLISFD